VNISLTRMHRQGDPIFSSSGNFLIYIYVEERQPFYTSREQSNLSSLGGVGKKEMWFAPSLAIVPG
jgi:hypothetical protein